MLCLENGRKSTFFGINILSHLDTGIFGLWRWAFQSQPGRAELSTKGNRPIKLPKEERKGGNLDQHAGIGTEGKGPEGTMWCRKRVRASVQNFPYRPFLLDL
jgi:hypothetical protein